jgi:sodium/bile acid cotransporter 7
MLLRPLPAIRKLHLDGFIVSLAMTLALATVLPCKGMAAQILKTTGTLAIAAVFFLQGARLSRDAVLHGIMHWRLHATIAAATFVLFPVLGGAMAKLFAAALPGSVWFGVLFLCTLPSTVQSSVALTSIARGNVPGAVCSATLSNVSGVLLTPLLFATLTRARGNVVDLHGISSVVLQLLVPFIAGHLMRRWLGQWAERNRRMFSVTDRASILLVVYTAFSAAIVNGIWNYIPARLVAALMLVAVALLGLVLLVMIGSSRVLRLDCADEVALVFCGAQKSLVSGVPIANALFPGSAVGLILLPILIYYPLQLLVCAGLARRYADSTATQRVSERRVSEIASLRSQ